MGLQGTGSARVQVVAETLRFLADGWVRDEDDQRWLRDVAEQIERELTPDCCPLCEEIVCDDHCPLAPVRAGLPHDR